MPNIKHLKVERTSSEKYEKNRETFIRNSQRYYAKNRESIIRKNKEKKYNCLCGECDVSFINRMRHINSNKHKNRLIALFQDRKQLKTYNKIATMIKIIQDAIQKVRKQIETPELEIPLCIEVTKKTVLTIPIKKYEKKLTNSKLPLNIFCMCGTNINWYWRKRHQSTVNHSKKLSDLFCEVKLIL